MQASDLPKARSVSVLRKTLNGLTFFFSLYLFCACKPRRYVRSSSWHLQRYEVQGRGEGKRTLLFLSW